MHDISYRRWSEKYQHCDRRPAVQISLQHSFVSLVSLHSGEIDDQVPDAPDQHGSKTPGLLLLLDFSLLNDE
jgi:hypothetical protein